MLYDLILKNRSYRSFDEGRRISREELLNFVDHARLSASSRNKQPLAYRLACTPEECDATLNLTSWAGLLKEVKLPPKGRAPTAYIIICCDTTIAPTPELFMRDVGIAAQTILLAATERGLGGCMIGSFKSEKLKEALAIPGQYIPMLTLALGKPDERVMLTSAEGGSVDYYREGEVHCVPKRRLGDIII